MAWAKLDDQLHGHRKIKRAWKCRPALGLHMMALSYSACYDLDGLVPEEFVEEKLPAKRERDAAVAALVEAGLWEIVDDGWLVHDWDEYNGDAKTREAARAAKSEAGKKGAAARWKPMANDGTCHESAISETVAEDGSRGTGVQDPSPSPSPTTKSSVEPARLDAARERLQGDQVKQVFDMWINSTGRTAQTKLDPKRRRRIVAGLSSHGLQDCLDAVCGWEKSPFHRGENTDGTKHNEIELLLRDAAHIEKFRDLQRGPSTEVRGDGFGARLNASTL